MMQRKWSQVEHRSYRWLAACPRRDLEWLQSCFINRYPQLHFVFESAEPRISVGFIQKIFA